MVSKYFGQILTFILLGVCSLPLKGQNKSNLDKNVLDGKQIIVGTSSKARQVSTAIYYKVLETSNDKNYSSNQARLDSLASWIDSIKTNSEKRIKGIRIIGYASPEGNEGQNWQLARSRAQSVADFIKSIAPEMSSMMTVTSKGADWKGAYEKISASDIQGKEVILNIISKTPVMTGTDGRYRYLRKEKLFLIDGGKTYQYIVDNFCGDLRRTEVIIDFSEETSVMAFVRNSMKNGTKGNGLEAKENEIAKNSVKAAVPAAADTSVKKASGSKVAESAMKETGDADKAGIMRTPMMIDTTLAPIAGSKTYGKTYKAPAAFTKKPLFAAKTNLLYDAGTVLNVAVEIPMGKHWSAGLDYKFPWWVWDHNSRCLEIIHGDGFARYWFGNRTSRRVLTGGFAGIMLGGGYYDLEPHNTGYQGEFYTASAECGYAFRINGHWSFELSAGLGWLGTKYRYYKGVQDDQHLVWQHSGRYTWLGPTKVNASIVYLFHHKVKQEAGK